MDQNSPVDDDVTLSFTDLLEANRRHHASFTGTGLPGRAGRGLAIVTCIDTRLDPLAMLGLEPGDAKIARNAGARVTDDVLRSLALSTALLGVDRIALIAHTDCALAKSTDEQLRAHVASASGGDTSGWEPLAVTDQPGAVQDDVELIRRHPLIRPGVVVAGFVYDVDSGVLHALG